MTPEETMAKNFIRAEQRVRWAILAVFQNDHTTARVAVDAVYKTGLPPSEVLTGDLEKTVKNWDLLSRKEKSAAKLAQYAATVATIFS